MEKRTAIRDYMPVVCSNGGQFATVDHLDGAAIKLTRDDYGQHHWIPLDWVVRVDSAVHINRTTEQAMREWQSVPPPVMTESHAEATPS